MDDEIRKEFQTWLDGIIAERFSGCEEEHDDMSAAEAVKERAARASPAPNISQPSGGAIRIAFDVTVSMAELSTWDAKRLSAFFAGMAAVLAAKNGTTAPSD